VALERFKTQVLLLHSEQNALDTLSSGFNDRYTVHCATSGSEALNTLGEIKIDVIVSAQKLPGMSGLEALREARKRSPETIGILLAENEDVGLEALVGDKEVFQVVRGSVTPDSLKKLIDGATQQARLMALAESANDMAANPDEPVGEHIVMETSENGSTIISDGTGRLPALDPRKISAAADIGMRGVDVLVLTQDEEFLATVRESARGLHNVIHANTAKQADEAVTRHKIGVAVVDAAMAGGDVEKLTLHLRSSVPRLVAIVAGRRDDGEMLMDLINRGKVYRFLLKPVSPGRARLAIEASVKHHLEAPDSAFLKAGGATPAGTAKAQPRTVPEPAAAPIAKPEPPPAARLRPLGRPAPPPTAAARPPAAPKPQAAPKPKAAPKPPAIPKPPAASKPQATPKPQAARPIAVPKPLAAPKPPTIAKPQAAPKSQAPAKPLPVAKPKVSASVVEPEAPRQAAAKVSTETSISVRRDEALSPVGDGMSTVFDGNGGGFTSKMAGIVSAVRKPFSSAADADPSRAAAATTAGTSGGSTLKKPLFLASSAVVLVAAAALAWWLFPGSENPDVTATPVVRTPSITEADPVVEPEPAAQEQAPDEPATRIDEVLAEARLAADAGQVYDPAGSNAIELYLAAMQSVPGNPIIEAEFDTIIERALTMAESALLDRRSADARAALDRVSLADPENSRLPFLRAQLSQLQLREYLDNARAAIREARYEDATAALNQARALSVGDATEVELVAEELSAALSAQQVDELLANASARLEEGKLIEPSNDNSRYYYELALSNDPDNAAARQGLITIAGKLVLQARADIDQGNLDLAEDMSAEARRLDPTSREVAALEDALQAAYDRQEQERIAAEQRAAEQRAAAERAAAERASAERAAAEKAAAEKAAAERAAAEKVAADRAAAEQAAAEKAAAERRAAEQGTAGQVPVESRQPPVALAVQAAETPGGQESPVERPAAQTATNLAGESTVPAPQAVAALPVSANLLNRTKYVAPKYPRSAERRGISGWVDVVFTVDIDGTVTDIEVQNSDPGDTFVAAATNAIAGWEFEPVIENGVAIRKRAAVRMMFAIE